MAKRSKKPKEPKPRAKPTSPEADLCARFVLAARAQGFRVYPETGGHDLLLVASDHCEGFQEGDQIGVQAKIRGNFKVLTQALPKTGLYAVGPHYYAVLVPEVMWDFSEVAHALKITVISGYERIDGEWPIHRLKWYRHAPANTAWVPDCEVESLRGGVSGPSGLSRWKMQAIKLMMLGEIRGYITKQDFKDHGVDHRRFLQLGWIVGCEGFVTVNGKKQKQYVVLTDNDPPHVKFAAVTKAMSDAGLFDTYGETPCTASAAANP